MNHCFHVLNRLQQLSFLSWTGWELSANLFEFNTAHVLHSQFEKFRVVKNCASSCMFSEDSRVVVRSSAIYSFRHQLSIEVSLIGGNFPVGLVLLWGLKKGDFLAPKGAPKIGQKGAPQSPKPNGKLLLIGIPYFCFVSAVQLAVKHLRCHTGVGFAKPDVESPKEPHVFGGQASPGIMI